MYTTNSISACFTQILALLLHPVPSHLRCPYIEHRHGDRNILRPHLVT